jgi:hypothetical protein
MLDSSEPSDGVLYTRLGNQVTTAASPTDGCCQYCGMAGTRVLHRPEGLEGPPIKIVFRTRVLYSCGRDHFEQMLREEIRADLHEQWADLTARPNLPTELFAIAFFERRAEERASAVRVATKQRRPESVRWKVHDRYCWRCGTHFPVAMTETRCVTCGELQRLFLRETGPMCAVVAAADAS